MRNWLRRWMAYVLFPAGLVLLFVPLSTHRSGYAERDAVFLGVPATPEGDAAQAPALAALPPEDLAATPALQAAVREIVADLDLFGKPWSYVLSRPDIPPEEWTSFQSLHAPDGIFQYENRVFEGRLSPETIQIQIEVPHLRTGGRIAGGVFVLLSVLALAGCHAAPPAGGIRIGRRSAIVIWDVIIIAVGVPFSLWFLDMLFAHVFQTAPEWKEDITWGMGFFMVVLSNPVLALITTAMAAQTLWITRDTLRLKGLFGSSSMAWTELEGIAVAHAFTPRKAGGVPASHRVMKLLEIHGGGSTLRILEPPYASTKKLILEKLAEHAPGEWQERIATAGKEWLSKW
ncbi:MAG: hypothetical protein EOM72_04645 [Opitutae bacterium]|nr:hypothetical protein [Opitutae bacterium]